VTIRPREALPAIALLTALLALTPPGSVRAEVGVLTDSTTGQTSGPYSLSITDDSDPIMTVWQRFSPPGSPRHVLNPGGDLNGDGPPSILRSRLTGLPVVVWSQKTASGFDVVISRFEDGAWTGPDVIAGTPADELDPHLIESAEGGFDLFYWVDDDASRTVYHRHAPADLGSWSPATPVSRPDDLASHPKGIHHEGTLRVAYEIDLGTGVPKDVVLARQDGGDFLVEVLATSYNTGELWPEPHSHDGRFWVDWIDATYGNPSHGEMAWLRQSDLGEWEVSRYEPFAGEVQREFHVRGTIRDEALTLP
jgi:hypothetical protein